MHLSKVTYCVMVTIHSLCHQAIPSMHAKRWLWRKFWSFRMCFRFPLYDNLQGMSIPPLWQQYRLPLCVNTWRARVTPPQSFRQHTKRFVPSGTDSALLVKTMRTGIRMLVMSVLVMSTGTGCPWLCTYIWVFDGYGDNHTTRTEMVVVRAFNGNLTVAHALCT